MAKRRISAKQIQGEIARRLTAAQRMPELYKTLSKWTPGQADPADAGANWHVDNLRHAARIDGQAKAQVASDEIRRVVAEVQAQFDCSDW